jgi:hypothetical protein
MADPAFNLANYLNTKQLKKEIAQGDVPSNFVSWVYIIVLVSLFVVPATWFIVWLVS